MLSFDNILHDQIDYKLNLFWKNDMLEFAKGKGMDFGFSLAPCLHLSFIVHEGQGNQSPRHS